MQYLMLVFHTDPERWAALSVDERNQVHRDCFAWHEDLVSKGKSLGAAGLQPPKTATTLRKKEGKVVVTDGPFLESKEVLGGFEHLNCDSVEEAIEIAKQFPALRAGAAVELRPLVEGMCEG